MQTYRAMALCLLGMLLLLLTGCGPQKQAAADFSLNYLDGTAAEEPLTIAPGETVRLRVQSEMTDYQVETVSVSRASVLTAAWVDDVLLVRGGAEEGTASVELALSAEDYQPWKWEVPVTVALPPMGIAVSSAQEELPGATARYKDGALTMQRGDTYRLTVSAAEGSYLYYRWEGLAATASLEGNVLVVTAKETGEGVVYVSAKKDDRTTDELAIPVTVQAPALDLSLSSLDFDPAAPVLTAGKDHLFTLVGGPSDCTWELSVDAARARLQQEGNQVLVHPLVSGPLVLTGRAAAPGYQSTALKFSMRAVEAAAPLRLSGGQLPADGSNRVALSLGETLTLEVDAAGSSLSYLYPEELFTLTEFDGFLELEPVRAGSGSLQVRAKAEGLPDSVRTLQMEIAPAKLQIAASMDEIVIDLRDRPQVELTVNEPDAQLRVSISSPIARVMIQDGSLWVVPQQEGEAVITITAQREDSMDGTLELPLVIESDRVFLEADTEEVVTSVGEPVEVSFTLDPPDSAVGVTIDGSTAVVYYRDGRLFIEPKSPGTATITVTAEKTGYAVARLPIHLTVVEQDLEKGEKETE